MKNPSTQRAGIVRRAATDIGACAHLVGALCADAGIEGTAMSAVRLLASILLDHAEELEALEIELRREAVEA